MIITFYDIETNSLDKDKAEILEIGFVRVKPDFTFVKAGQLFFWQDGWDVGRTDIHGLTTEYMQKYKNDFIINMSQLFAIMKDGYIVGKNNHAFDDTILINFMNRHNFAMADKKISFSSTYRSSADIQKTHSKQWRKLMQAKGIDVGNKRGTLEEYLAETPYTKDVLSAICKDAGIEMRGNLLHSAAVDAMATYMVARYYATQYGVMPEFV